MKVLKITILSLLTIGTLTFLLPKTLANDYDGWANHFDECDLSVYVVIDGVISKFEASGNRNNCQPWITNTCRPHGCQAHSDLTALAKSIKEFVSVE